MVVVTVVVERVVVEKVVVVRVVVVVVCVDVVTGGPVHTIPVLAGVVAEVAFGTVRNPVHLKLRRAPVLTARHPRALFS